MKTSRRGVIAALMVSVGGFYNRLGAQGPQATLSSQGTFELTFQKGPARKLGDYEGCSIKSVGDGNLAYYDCSKVTPTPEPDFALIVNYDDRSVKLTANEIMDALEGK